MPNVDDHGLEVLKKAAQNLDAAPKKNYALQVLSMLPFAPPYNADTVTSTLNGLVRTIQYKNGGPSGTVLKTITVTYTSCDYLEFTAQVT